MMHPSDGQHPGAQVVWLLVPAASIACIGWLTYRGSFSRRGTSRYNVLR